MSGGSSSLFDPDVIDITPPAAQKLKHNKVIFS
uniref:Uncharacterized protein n=1 Tax=Nelumbo nucifera TaxID=4432 RepID=A0A822XSA4_NELNU|nr:TPA_asm: hypothetical protein HUJ06_024345 [Nelumbo nucifera]